jgi:hypothetical protein
MADNPTLVPSAFELECPSGTSKIALIVDEDQDYHFGRFDKPYTQDEDPLANTSNNNTSNDPTQPQQPSNTNAPANDPKPVNNSPSAKQEVQLLKQQDQSPITWGSHKGGEQPATNRDATGHKIFDFALANFNYNRNKGDRLNYDRFCGYFCVPRNRPLYIKVGGRRYRLTRKGKST